MPVISNQDAPEVPWRPGYRTYTLAGRAQGMSCTSSMSVLEPGAGAPLHVHDDADEVLIILEGVFEFRLGEEKRLVEANHTVSIPAGTPHGFTVVGPGKGRLFGFLPKLGVISGTRYLEGEPPKGAAQR